MTARTELGAAAVYNISGGAFILLFLDDFAVYLDFVLAGTSLFRFFSMNNAPNVCRARH